LPGGWGALRAVVDGAPGGRFGHGAPFEKVDVRADLPQPAMSTVAAATASGAIRVV